VCSDAGSVNAYRLSRSAIYAAQAETHIIILASQGVTQSAQRRKPCADCRVGERRTQAYNLPASTGATRSRAAETGNSMALTTTQRRVCTAAAGAIALLLVYQILEVGLEETPWLIGIVVLAGFLGLALAPAAPLAGQRSGPEIATDASVPSLDPVKAFRKATSLTRPRMAAVALPEGVAIGNSLFDDHVRLQADKLAWMAAFLLAEQSQFGFQETPAYQTLSATGGLTFARALQPTMANVSKQDLFKAAAKEMAECVAAVTSTKMALVSGLSYPMNPIFRVIERQLPVSVGVPANVVGDDARLEVAYGAMFRQAIEAARSQ
jgi:hypothetical protein